MGGRSSRAQRAASLSRCVGVPRNVAGSPKIGPVPKDTAPRLPNFGICVSNVDVKRTVGDKLSPTGPSSPGTIHPPVRDHVPFIGHAACDLSSRHRSCEFTAVNTNSGPIMPMPRNSNCRKSSRSLRASIGGFTLVEVMIAVAVISILVKIAYPTYQSYVKRSNRSAAESLMLDVANREQQYLLDKRSFLGGGASAVTTLLAVSSLPPEVGTYYNVTVTAAAGPPPTFTITATPKAGTMMAGDGNLTLDQAGTKLPAGKWEGR